MGTVPVTKRSRATKADDQFASLLRFSVLGLGFGGVWGVDEKGPRLVRVFYATNRGQAPHPSTQGAMMITDARGSGVTFGFSDVSIPPDHRLGAIERPTIWRFQVKEDDRSHVVLKAIYETEADYFWETFSDHAKSTSGRVLVYIHGFANTFEDAARRAAQMKYDLGFDGPTFFFSWPSKGSAVPVNYAPDAASMEWSVGDIAAVLKTMMQREGIKEIILIAHSMGAKATSLALAHADMQRLPPKGPRIREVVLAAPDIDRDLFTKELMPKIKALTQGVTIYASANDKALTLSKGFHAAPRLGSTDPSPTLVAGAQVIDASGVDTSFTGHAYFAENRSVIADLYYLINERLPPPRRATLERVASAGGDLWRFKQ